LLVHFVIEPMHKHLAYVPRVQGIASALGSVPHYSRLQYTTLSCV